MSFPVSDPHNKYAVIELYVHYDASQRETQSFVVLDLSWSFQRHENLKTPEQVVFPCFSFHVFLREVQFCHWADWTG